MKKTSLISLLICCITFSTTFTSCEDMLSPDSERHAYEVGKDTLYSYWGILKSLQNVAERYVILGECRGELVSGTAYISDSIRAILDFNRDEAVDGSCRYLKASDYYHVINSCNAYLAMCDRERVTGTLQPYMLKESAQVEAIRAWVYLQLVQVYKEVPFYTEPLLTTDDINAFMDQPKKVTIKNLVDELAPSLQAALQIELEYGLPQYDGYGRTRTICHSSKAMIPLNLILGDLYLAKGESKQDFETAAQYYYDYLSNNQGQGHMVPGGTLPIGYHNYGFKGEGMDRPIYLYASTTGSPWTETGAASTTRESITAIPSSTNKLWGTVLRGVNDVFGFTSEISVRTEETSDTTSSTTASVSLTPKYDAKQLAASDAYFNLCKEQTFEIYVGAMNGGSFSLADFTLTPDSTIGDARQYWVDDIYQTYSNGLRNTEKFITKQNPGGSFTTVYPMIYRKAMVWLRYAEALNRAGYHSYAFAILKNGLCNNDAWYPSALDEAGAEGNNDYAVRDSIWIFTDSAGVVLPVEGVNTMRTRADLEAYLYTYIGAETDSAYQEYAQTGSFAWAPESYENYTDENCQAALYYLDRREVLKSPSFLNFDFEVLNGNLSSPTVYYRSSLTQRGYNSTSVSRGTGSDPITIGIHARGCGMPLYNDKSSSYDYVKKIQEKAKAYGANLTKEDIYSGAYDNIVQNCVEDLIIDEGALELAFEGTRFFDLMRVAQHRNDPNYLASRLAKRDPSLLGKLQNMDNWFFKLPSE